MSSGFWIILAIVLVAFIAVIAVVATIVAVIVILAKDKKKNNKFIQTHAEVVSDVQKPMV